MKCLLTNYNAMDTLFKAFHLPAGKAGLTYKKQ
jgi:hypothetical protein